MTNTIKTLVDLYRSVFCAWWMPFDYEKMIYRRWRDGKWEYRPASPEERKKMDLASDMAVW